MQPSREPGHNRSLGLIAATSLVTGSMIGTGIFLKPAVMAQHAGSIPMVLLAWLAAGLLSYAGALTYGELCSRLPAAGGEYALLREGYGSFTAYMYGWMRFTIGAPGSAASYAVGAAAFLQVAMPYAHLGVKVWQVAAVFILFFTLINCLTLFVSAGVQVTLTAIKVLSLLTITYALLFIAPASPVNPPVVQWPGMVSFSAALMAALWAYDGWNNLPMMGGEVRHPQRNLPAALAIGMGVVLLIYVVVNIGYFRVLPFAEIIAANPSSNAAAQPVATAAMQSVIPGASLRVIAVLMVVSALGALNGSILSSARVPYAMAEDRVFFAPLAQRTRAHAIPVIATISQGMIAVLLAFSGSFDQLTDSVVFASWIFYALTAGAVFRLRQKNIGGRAVRFRVPVYPILPIVFITCSVALIIYAVFAMPVLTGIGIAIMLSGMPLYFYFKRGH